MTFEWKSLEMEAKICSFGIRVFNLACIKD